MQMLYLETMESVWESASVDRRFFRDVAVTFENRPAESPSDEMAEPFADTRRHNDPLSDRILYGLMSEHDSVHQNVGYLHRIWD